MHSETQVRILPGAPNNSPALSSPGFAASGLAAFGPATSQHRIDKLTQSGCAVAARRCPKGEAHSAAAILPIGRAQQPTFQHRSFRRLAALDAAPPEPATTREQGSASRRGRVAPSRTGPPTLDLQGVTEPFATTVFRVHIRVVATSEHDDATHEADLWCKRSIPVPTPAPHNPGGETLTFQSSGAGRRNGDDSGKHQQGVTGACLSGLSRDRPSGGSALCRFLAPVTA